MIVLICLSSVVISEETGLPSYLKAEDGWEKLPLKENGGETFYRSSDGNVLIYANPNGPDRIIVSEGTNMAVKDFGINENDIVRYNGNTAVLGVVQQTSKQEQQTRISGGKPTTTTVTVYTVTSVSIELNNNRASVATTTSLQQQSVENHLNDAKTPLTTGYPNLNRDPVAVQISDSLRDTLRQETEAQIAQLPPGSIIPLYSTPTEMNPEEIKAYIKDSTGVKIPAGVYIGPAYLKNINLQLGKSADAPIDQDSIDAIASIYAPDPAVTRIAGNREQLNSISSLQPVYGLMELTDNNGNKQSLHGTAYVDPTTGEVKAFKDEKTGSAFTVNGDKAACGIKCGSSAGKPFTARVTTQIDVANSCPVYRNV